MRNLILVFLGVFSLSGYSQGFVENRITPMLNAHKELMKVHPIPSTKEWNCPPNLVQNQIETFTFLDSLSTNITYDEKYFATFLTNGCTDYFEVLFTHQLFLPDYVSALKNFNLNEKYALLPLTVSASNPSLKYLDDKSGAWQLSFVTARKYGLTINQWYDERNDIKKSSRAAAAYLSFLTDYYLNNELLIVSAYYTSVPFVNKQLNKLENVNADAFVNSLPSEIQGYLYYLKAWSNWIENFDNSNTKNVQPAKLNLTSVETQDTLSFEIISDIMDVSVVELRMMNPVFVGETIFPNSSQSFKLPQNKAAFFSEKYIEFIAFQKAEEERKKKELAELKKRMESGIPDLDKFKAVTYTVRSGDVLGKIAEQNNVKVSSIKQWNNLRSDRIDVGQKLVLYVSKNKSNSLPSEKADNKIKTKPTKPNPGKGKPQVYTVRPGESLWLIAKKYPGVSAENIMEWNGCTEKISPGMILKIYQGE